MDGARPLCEECIDEDLQNAYFEGYTGKVEVENLLGKVEVETFLFSTSFKRSYLPVSSFHARGVTAKLLFSLVIFISC